MCEQGLSKRADFERAGVDAGWVLDKDPERTRFGGGGYCVSVVWLNDFPASMKVTDEHGTIVQTLSFLAEKWSIGAHLMRWLGVSPGRCDTEPLPVLVRRYADTLRLLDCGRKYPAHAVADVLDRLLQEAR